ncbi:hypothetical protein LJR258_006590 [Rhizobium sp. LjRoot258]
MGLRSLFGVASNGRLDSDAQKRKSPLAIESIAERYWGVVRTRAIAASEFKASSACHMAPAARPMLTLRDLLARKPVIGRKQCGWPAPPIPTICEQRRGNIPHRYGNHTYDLLDNFLQRCEN